MDTYRTHEDLCSLKPALRIFCNQKQIFFDISTCLHNIFMINKRSFDYSEF